MARAILLAATMAAAALFMLLAAAPAPGHAMDFGDRDLASEDSLRALYERWREQHGVARDLGDRVHRFNVFKANVRLIHDFNRRDAPYKLRLNRFGDMSADEFHRASSRVSHHRMFRRKEGGGGFMHGSARDVPPALDWRQKGAVTAVKDQGECESCWAFSAIAAVEGINAIRTKNLTSLSEQQLVDCDTESNAGCNGGLMDDAFQYIAKHGVAAEDAYPYKARQASCNKKPSAVVTIDGYQDVPANDEAALKKAVAAQPVAVAIKAGGGSHFQFYSEGVFTGNCGPELDHGVTAVGYGATVDGTKYWIVKNSWGGDWGEKGYIRMERDVKDKEGLCGIAMEASYPVKAAPNPKHAGVHDEL